MCNNLILVLISTLVLVQHAYAEGVRITPRWIEENPGRLSLLSGSGFRGHTDYIATLTTDRAALFEVWTKVQFVTGDKWTSPWITAKVRAGAPAKTVRFGDTSLGIYAASAPSGDFRENVIYEVYKVPVKADAKGKGVWTRELS
jgi:hypothetical protein